MSLQQANININYGNNKSEMFRVITVIHMTNFIEYIFPLHDRSISNTGHKGNKKAKFYKRQ